MKNVLVGLTGQQFRYTLPGLSAALELAPAHGWLPMGTVAPEVIDEYVADRRLVALGDRHVDVLLAGTGIYRDGGEWDGDYLRSEGQAVCGDDAMNLAAALRLAATALRERESVLAATAPDGTTARQPFSIALHPDGTVVQTIRTDEQEYLELLDTYLGEDNARYLEKLAAFCDKGAFRIH